MRFSAARRTWIGANGEVIAFDTGPGNAPIDDWAHAHTGKAYDEDGKLAAGGRANEARITQALGDPFFAQKPPKSLDRFDFTAKLAEGLSPEDGAATLAAFTAAAIAAANASYPAQPARDSGGSAVRGVLPAPVRR